MNNQEKKAELKKYGNLNKAIDQKIAELARLRAKCEKVTTSISSMPKGGNQTLEDAYAKMIDLADEINAEIDRYVDMRRDIEAKINTVGDMTLQTLLRYRYIDGLTWEQIAVNMNYCYMQVCRLHGKALNEIM